MRRDWNIISAWGGAGGAVAATQTDAVRRPLLTQPRCAAGRSPDTITPSRDELRAWLRSEAHIDQPWLRLFS